MPNTRIRDQWEPMVKSIVADNPKWGPRRILGELRNRAKTQGLSKDYPSERTIQRIKDDITPEEMVEYRSFSWPESMERGDLPWEASAAALELLRFYDSAFVAAPGDGPPRPSVRLVTWFWRVSLAAPGAPVDIRQGVADVLVLSESIPEYSPQRQAEWYLAYAPWESEASRKRYLAAITRAENPLPSVRDVTNDEPYQTLVTDWWLPEHVQTLMRNWRVPEHVMKLFGYDEEGEDNG